MLSLILERFEENLNHHLVEGFGLDSLLRVGMTEDRCALALEGLQEHRASPCTSDLWQEEQKK